MPLVLIGVAVKEYELFIRARLRAPSEEDAWLISFDIARDPRVTTWDVVSGPTLDYELFDGIGEV